MSVSSNYQQSTAHSAYECVRKYCNTISSTWSEKLYVQEQGEVFHQKIANRNNFVKIIPHKIVANVASVVGAVASVIAQIVAGSVFYAIDLGCAASHSSEPATAPGGRSANSEGNYEHYWKQASKECFSLVYGYVTELLPVLVGRIFSPVQLVHYTGAFNNRKPDQYYLLNA